MAARDQELEWAFLETVELVQSRSGPRGHDSGASEVQEPGEEPSAPVELDAYEVERARSARHDEAAGDAAAKR
jgi:hypothetical protein